MTVNKPFRNPQSRRPPEEEEDSPLEPSSRASGIRDETAEADGGSAVDPFDESEVTLAIPRTQTSSNDAAGPGRRFGNYELISEIARGGMGVVYKARQLRPNRLVAIKMILAGSLASAEDIKRFYVEAEAAAHIERRGIVPIIEVGEYKGQHFFSMGFIEGESLSARIMRGPLPPAAAARMLLAIAESVQFAHDHGILHRDLKPANVIIDKEDHPWITDFGLARRADDHSELTTTGQILGTPHYMSPEQAAGRVHDISESADVYALGAILYAALAGRPPFHAASTAETLRQVMQQDPVPPRVINPSVPLDLDTICLRCLEKSPARRYARAQDVADELKRFLDGKPVHSRRVTKVEQAWRWCKRQPLVASLLAALLLSMLIGITVSSWLAYTAGVRAQEAVYNFKLAAKNEADSNNFAAQMVQERNQKTARLRDAYYSQAQAVRWSGRVGRRSLGLKALTQAAAIEPSLELRNEAIATLAQFDLEARDVGSGISSDTQTVTFSLDGKLNVRSDAKGNLSVRATSDNPIMEKEVALLPGPGFPAWVVQLSSGGKYVAAKYHAASDDNHPLLLVWDIESRKQVLKMPGAQIHPPQAFSDDGTALVVYSMTEGKLLRISTLDWKIAAEKTALPPYSVAWDRSASRLAVSRSQQVAIHDSQTFEERQAFSFPAQIRGLSWSADDNWIGAASADSIIYLQHTEQTELRRELHGHDAPVILVDFSRKGDLLASTGWDTRTCVWDVTSGKSIAVAPGAVDDLRFIQDDQALANYRDGARFGLWGVTSQELFRPLPIPATALEVEGWGGTLLPGGRFLAAACQDGVRVWELRTRRVVTLIPFPSCRSVIYDEAGKQLLLSGLTGIAHCSIRLPAGDLGEEFSAGTPERFTGIPSLMMERMAWSKARRRAAVACRESGQVLLIDVDSGKQQLLSGTHAGASFIDITADGEWIATGAWANKGVGLWSSREGRLMRILPVESSAAVRFSPSGELLVTGTGGEYVLWDVKSDKRLRSWPRSNTGALWGSLAFSADGSLLAIVPSPDLVRLIDVRSGNELATLEAPTPLRLSWLEFGADRDDLMVAGKRQFAVWHLPALRKELSALRLDWTDRSDSSVTSNAPDIPSP